MCIRDRSYDILTIPPFDRQFKRLLKKYPSIKIDFSDFLAELEQNSIQGTELGKNCYKIRIKISSKNKGKSGGGRIIANILISKEKVYLIAIYDKCEKETLSDKELKSLLQSIPEN